MTIVGYTGRLLSEAAGRTDIFRTAIVFNVHGSIFLGIIRTGPLSSCCMTSV